jgi:predicted nucleotidyltransferase
MVAQSKELPDNIQSVLTAFVDSSKNTFKEDLRSIVLFGSGADGNLRPASDVNVIVVLERFDQTKADQMREPLRLAETAIKLKAMFLLVHEIEPASQAFSVKFADLKRRRKVLFGEDPFADLSVTRRFDFSFETDPFESDLAFARKLHLSRAARRTTCLNHCRYSWTTPCLRRNAPRIGRCVCTLTERSPSDDFFLIARGGQI